MRLPMRPARISTSHSVRSQSAGAIAPAAIITQGVSGLSMNLWDETVATLQVNDRTWSHVRLVAGNKYQIPLETFERIARTTEYDQGFGSPEIATDLTIIGTDFWMTRAEYDGREWWEFHTMPTTDLPMRGDIRHLAVQPGAVGWKTLNQINDPTG